MGKLFTKSSDVGNMVREKFGTADNYLVAVKHNSMLKGNRERLKQLIEHNFFRAA